MKTTVSQAVVFYVDAPFYYLETISVLCYVQL